jgi:hypothetical protein
MSVSTHQYSACALALAGALACGGFAAHADGRDDQRNNRGDDDQRVKTVFVVAMENHNWTQPATITSPQQIFQNPAAPFVNALANGTSGISEQVAFANGYINAGVGVHPSEPNYIWAEAGTNLGVSNDDNPYHADCSPDTVQTTDQHLTAFLTRATRTWRSYQEDTDVDAANTPLPQSAWTVPLFNVSGLFARPGGECVDLLRPVQLRLEAQSDGVLQRHERRVQHDHIEPHAAAVRTAAAARARPAARHRGRLQLDHAEPVQRHAHDTHGQLRRVHRRRRADRAGRQLPGAHRSADHGVRRVQARRCDRAVVGREYSHSSFLRTMQEIFGVDPQHGYPWLGDAVNATDLSALFQHTLK